MHKLDFDESLPEPTDLWDMRDKTLPRDGVVTAYGPTSYYNPRTDTSAWYFQHRFGHLTVGGFETGLGPLVRELRRIGELYPDCELIRVQEIF
jgi:hypothetical protein